MIIRTHDFETSRHNILLHHKWPNLLVERYITLILSHNLSTVGRGVHRCQANSLLSLHITKRDRAVEQHHVSKPPYLLAHRIRRQISIVVPCIYTSVVMPAKFQAIYAVAYPSAIWGACKLCRYRIRVYHCVPHAQWSSTYDRSGAVDFLASY